MKIHIIHDSNLSTLKYSNLKYSNMVILSMILLSNNGHFVYDSSHGFTWGKNSPPPLAVTR